MTTRPDHAGPATASWGRRIVALLIDWAASTLVVVAIVGWDRYSESGANVLPLVVFWLESAVGVALAGASFGQLVTGIRVHRTDGRPLGLLGALLRQLLVCLVVPPLVFRPDGRGLHDLWTGSGAYRHSATG
jgi:uncharacterized RDD family membrane protein YckC